MTLSLLAAPAAGLAQTAVAPQPVLVELFTSEGCSSCPPADRQLLDIDRKQPFAGARVVVLSEHVDYWNSLGWRDPYSLHLWSERQDEYGRQFGLDGVYTPQIVVDGTHQLVGGDGRALRSAVEESARGRHLPIAITSATRSGGSLQVVFTAGPSEKAILYAVIADESDQSSVERGENAGRRLEHVAVARSVTRIADLDGPALSREAQISLPPDSGNRRLRLILFARVAKTGHIVGVEERGL